MQPRTRKYVKGYGSFARNFYKYKKKLLDTGLDALKAASEKVVHKTTEGTGEFIGNKIAEKIVKSKHVIDENPRNVEEIIIAPEQKEEKFNELRQIL